MGNPTSLDLFRCLYDGIGIGYIEVRGQTIPEQPGGKLAYREWFEWPGEIEKIPTAIAPHVGKMNLWYGVGLRKERGSGKKKDVALVPALFVDIDFKNTPEEQARKALKEFPLKPSVGVHTGGGFHAYWLLKEPIFPSQFPLFEAHLKALAKHLGADTQACHADLGLRIPQTVNIKYTPHRPVEIISGPRDLRYTLLDFDFLTIEEPKNEGENSESGPRNADNELDEVLFKKLKENISNIWIENFRHSLSLIVAGVLAHAGFKEEAAVKLINAVCKRTNDDQIEDRTASVRDTYRKYKAGDPVCGLPTLEKMADEFPQLIQTRAKNVINDIKETIPERNDGQNNTIGSFQILQINKFDSDMPRYDVIISYKDERLAVLVEGGTFLSYEKFRNALFQATSNVILPYITQRRWEKKIQQASISNLKIIKAPKEATNRGTIEEELDSFIEDKKENPDVGALKTFAGVDEDGNTFFRLSAFKSFLREKAVKVTDRELVHQLMTDGWHNDRFRHKGRLARFWIKRVADPKKAQKIEDMFGPVDGNGASL